MMMMMMMMMPPSVEIRRHTKVRGALVGRVKGDGVEVGKPVV